MDHQFHAHARHELRQLRRIALWRRFALLIATSSTLLLAACGGGGGSGGTAPPSGGGDSGFALTVTVSGNGSVASTPTGISCGTTCSAVFAANSSVTLTATPAQGQTLSGWGGACTGTASTCTVTMNEAKSVTATFAPTQGTSFALSVSVTGNGTVTSSPAGINCGTACNANFAANTSVTLTAAPAAGQSFSAWGGACSGSSSTCTVTMSQARSVTATFAPTQGGSFALSVSVTGNGTVTSSPAGINCGTTCNANFAANTSVTLTATPAAGHVLQSWGGACAGSAATCTLQMSQARSVSATFANSGTSTLTYIYSSQTPASGIVNSLTQLNTQGATGNAFVGPYSLDGTSYFHLFIKPSNGATFSYTSITADTSNATPDSFVQVLNTQGAQGYAYKGALIFPGSATTTLLFVKNNSKTATYSYQFTSVSTLNDEAAYVQDMNTKGSNGFGLLGSFLSDPQNLSTQFLLYSKDNTSNATYAYKFKPISFPTRDELLAEVNAEGANGYMWRGGFGIGATPRFLYEKPSNIPTPVVYSIELAVLSGTNAFLQQLNQLAAQGNFFAGPYALDNNSTIYHVFYKGPPTTSPLQGVIIP